MRKILARAGARRRAPGRLGWHGERSTGRGLEGGSVPVLYNLGGGTGAVWDYPQVKPKISSKATEYERTGPCCTKADQHYYKVTVTLSGVRSRGGVRPGPYFTRRQPEAQPCLREPTCIAAMADDPVRRCDGVSTGSVVNQSASLGVLPASRPRASMTGRSA
jgi:hypothetical protein